MPHKKKLLKQKPGQSRVGGGIAKLAAAAQASRGRDVSALAKKPLRRKSPGNATELGRTAKAFSQRQQLSQASQSKPKVPLRQKVPLKKVPLKR